MYPGCVCCCFSWSQPTWKPLPLSVHSSTEGKLISTVWGQTDKQAQTQPDDAIGQAPRPPPPPPPPPPYVPLTAINSPWANQCKQERLWSVSSPPLSDLPPSSLPSPPQPRPVLSNRPLAPPGHRWSLGAEPRQTRLCAIRIFKINVMDIFSEENVSFACLSCMYISFTYCWGLYFPTKGTGFPQMSVLSIRMTM